MIDLAISTNKHGHQDRKWRWNTEQRVKRETAKEKTWETISKQARESYH